MKWKFEPEARVRRLFEQVVRDLKEVEGAGDLIGLRQELQSFISGVKNNRDTSQCLKLYIEELKKILRKHTDIGKGKQRKQYEKVGIGSGTEWVSTFSAHRNKP